ncbi:MAG TPA: hypothetical protein VGF94_21070 [Kofleriaceae bacterium]
MAVAVGCKGKPTHQEPVSAETGSSVAAKPAKPPAGEELQLPPASGTPPIKTTKPIDDATFKKLNTMTFPGFALTPGYNGVRIVERHLTLTAPKLRALVIVEPCKRNCDPMELAKWKDKPSLKNQLSKELQDAKDTTFEVGQTDLDGAPMVYTYQLGQVTTPAGGSYSDMYILYYNDGVNQATVMAAYVDDPTASKNDMAQIAPKEDLEKLAKAFMDAYTHAWAS